MVRKVVDFKDVALKIELEPLTSADELKIMEYCKDYDGGQYMEALKIASISCSIKKMNDIDLNGDSVDYDDKGIKKSKSKFLYMTEYLREWPSVILETLFEAFSDMVREAEFKTAKNASFERFAMADKLPEIAEKKFKEVEEKEVLNETEKLNKAVENELSEANANLL